MGESIFYQLLWLFLLYSFIGWLGETCITVIKTKLFSNRGILSGPFCVVYGICAVIMTVGFNDLKESWIFLFLGCMSVSTVIEWIAAHMLEKTGQSRWWNYSNKKWNLDGYVCLQYSVAWGILGVLGLKYVNPLLLSFYEMFPATVMKIVLWTVAAIMIMDGAGSYMVAAGIQERFPNAEKMKHRLGNISIRFGNYIADYINRRMERAYPKRQKQQKSRVKETVFAKGCGFYKLVLLFFIGAFLGDIIETIFCRLTAGVWMSRSSVVWGPFSIVWGLAIVLATALLHNHRHKSDSFVFLFGTVLGGVYEYLCSVFTEAVFGQVFWDYSEIPFNLGGRINLLYCFFWGIAAVIWLKRLYPVLSEKIEKLPMKMGKVFTWSFLVFMICNIAMSGMALTRYTERAYGVSSESRLEEWIDERFSDEVMERIYSNAKTTS